MMGTDTIVMLMGPDHPVFTAFGQPNPERIIVDLTSSTDHAIEPIMVNDGLVAEVSVSPYSTGTGSEMTRVEVLPRGSCRSRGEIGTGRAAGANLGGQQCRRLRYER